MTIRFVADPARHGEAPALVFPGRPPVAYAELARRIASFKARLGGAKQLVAIEMAPSEHTIVCYLAALSAGHAVALLPSDDRASWDAFVDRFQPELVYRQADGRWRLEDVSTATATTLHPDLALILVTSGSTGEGKAVRLSAEAVAANAASIRQFLELRPDDRGALILPLHYSYGLSVLNSHLAAGGSLYLPGGSVLDPGFAEGLRDHRVTNLAGVPHSYELFEKIDLRDEPLPHLRFMTVAGGRLAPDLVRRYHTHLARDGKRFFVMYGQTEAAARIAYVPPELLARHPDRIGIAIPGGELGLIDDAGRPVAQPETVGELVYRGPNVMMGYAETRADLARGHEVDLLRTGDLACRNAAGLYRIAGRLRRMSKFSGVRVGHDALEAALAREGIAVAVVGDDRSVLAVFTSAHTVEHVRKRLARIARIGLAQVNAVAVSDLPRLATGKVDYEALRARLSEDRPPDAAGIEAAFRQAFFPHPLSERDSFASLGGDSLRYVELSMALDRSLGRTPPGWERMSVAELRRLEPQARSGRTISTDLVARALAILMVVVHHQTLWPLPGGAPAMVVLIGYGLARFQRPSLVAGDVATFIRPLLSVLVPYYLIVAGYALAWGEIPWASVFLVGNFGFADPVRHSMLPFLYWFVEVFAQMLLLFAALFLFAPVRRLATRDPFRFGLVLLAGAVAARFAGPQLWPMGGRELFALWWMFHLAALGWCVAFAGTPRRRLLLVAIAAVLMPSLACLGGNWIGSWVRYELQFVLLVALLYVPSVRLPGWLASMILPVAAATYHIYLVHRFVPELLMAPFGGRLPPALFSLVAIVGGIALGLLVYEAQRAVLRSAVRFSASSLTRRRPAAEPVA